MSRPPLAFAIAAGLVAAGTLAVLVLGWPGLLRDDDGSVPPGYVYRDGSRLYLDGSPYRFKGFNVYWANNRQGDDCGPPIGIGTLTAALDSLRGSSNAVRAWFFQSDATVGGVRDWSAFDRTLDAMGARGLKVVVTLGDQHGTCADPPGGLKDINWYREGYATQVPPGYPQTYRDYVRSVVTRYADRPEILAWQLINEASVVTPGVGCADELEAARVLRAWADDMAGLIRSIDPHHLISLGSGLQGACGLAVTADPSSNSYGYVHSSPHIDLCEYHDYNVSEVPLFILQQWEMDTCAALDKPFFVGELGIDQRDPRRPEVLKAKLEAQFGYENEPAQGILVWVFGGSGAPCDQFCVQAGDPVLDVLADD